eukprot:396860_1
MKDRTKCIVFGYVREAQLESSMDIPLAIQYLLIKYYWIEETLTTHGSHIQVDGSTIVRRPRAKGDHWWTYNTVYGNKTIDVNDESIDMYQWAFTLCRIPDSVRLRVYIGIDSSDNEF